MASKKHLYVFLTVLLAFCIAAVSMVSGAAFASTPGTFEKDGEIVIGQITDTHYYSLNYCVPDGQGDFSKALITGTKLFLESGMIIKQGLNEVIEQNPDYLFVTGDITLNGELQSHLDMANMLRELQNTVRTENDNPGFQIFVVPGNHDMYNGEARYDHGGVKEEAFPITRKEFSKIYSSLGYPDMSTEDIDAFYDSLPEVLTAYLPFAPDAGKRFVNSETAPGIEIEYQFEYYNKADSEDYDSGDITYIATCPDNYTIIGLDEEVSNNYNGVHIGGKIFDSTYAYLDAKKASFEDRKLLALMHHNTVPHFEFEDTVLKDFTLYQWRTAADYLADLGVRYAFSGHMHANDIASHISFNGNQITDTEGGSLTGYLGGATYTKIEYGSVDGDYAEIMKTTYDLVDAVDFTYLFENGYMDDEYLQICGLTEFIEVKDGKHIVTDISEYSGTKLFRNVLNTVVYGYLNPDFIFGLSDMLGNIGGGEGGGLADFLDSFMPYVDTMLENIIYHLENVVLADYTYGGQNPLYNSTEPGYKLCGYLDELVGEATAIVVNGSGDTLEKIAIESYMTHMGGIDVRPEDGDPALLEAIANFRNGSVVRALLDVLLDEETGLLRLVRGLTLPIDLCRNMTAEQIDSMEGIFFLLMPNKTFNPHAVVLDDITGQVFNLLKMFGIDFSLDGKTIDEFITHTLESYLTDSFYTGLGTIAGDILFSFYFDDTPDAQPGAYKPYIPAWMEGVTYREGAIENTATRENGKLPSMLTVTFGSNPKTDKNFIWFTDKRVTGTDIQYMKGEFNAANATTASGTFNCYATTTASVDLGIFAMLLPIEAGRHSVELTGLEPGTTYSYRVGSAADGFWGPVYTFATAPEDDAPFEVLLLTDLQGFAKETYEKAARIMDNLGEVFDNGYDFVINCGDVVDNSRNLKHFEYLLDIMDRHWGNTSQVVSAGNHDSYSYEFEEEFWDLYLTNNSIKTEYSYLNFHYNFSTPNQNKSLSGSYYSFDYSGVHFTVLNTNDLENNKLSKKQINWLKDDLQNTDKAFKVVVMHKGPYTAGAHNTDTDVVAIRKQVTPIFADNGVALVLQGHDHTYTESYYLNREGQIVETDAQGKCKLGTDGTLYVNLGSMGDKFYNYIENENVPLEFGKSKHTPTLQNPTFGKLVFDGQALYYVGYEYDLDTDTITEIRYVAPGPQTDKEGLEGWEIALIVVGSVLGAGGIGVGIFFLIRKLRPVKKA